MCVLLSSYVYLLYCGCIAVSTLDAGLLARSQYSEGPATGHLDTAFLGFPESISQRFLTFLTRGALFRINFYGGIPCLPYVLQVNGV